MRFLHRTMQKAHEDSGFSLGELLVGTSMMAVTAGIFMTAVTTMGQDVRKQSNTVDALAGNRAVYTMLDKQVRYADEIEAPSDGVGTDTAPVAKANGKGYFEYVEFHVAANSSTSTCYQWRIDSDADKAQYRTSVVTSGVAAISGWITVATGVANDIQDYTDATKFQPMFSVPTPTTSQDNQQLSLWMVSARGVGNGVGNSSTKSQFTALNSDNTAPTSNQCLATPFGLDRPTS